jgi:hypothetical protein
MGDQRQEIEEQNHSLGLLVKVSREGMSPPATEAMLSRSRSPD